MPNTDPTLTALDDHHLSSGRRRDILDDRLILQQYGSLGTQPSMIDLISSLETAREWNDPPGEQYTEMRIAFLDPGPVAPRVLESYLSAIYDDVRLVSSRPARHPDGCVVFDVSISYGHSQWLRLFAARNRGGG